MKYKTIHMLIAVAISAAAVAPLSAEARGRYYRTNELTCNDNAAGSAIAGAVIGGIFGGILSGNSRDPGQGIAIGAAAGGMLGLGLNCQQEVQYYRSADDYLDRGDFETPYEWNGGYFEYDRTEYMANGSECYVYHSVVYTDYGTKRRTEMSCYSQGGWVHGYQRAQKHQRRKRW